MKKCFVEFNDQNAGNNSQSSSSSSNSSSQERPRIDFGTPYIEKGDKSSGTVKK